MSERGAEVTSHLHHLYENSIKTSNFDTVARQRVANTHLTKYFLHFDISSRKYIVTVYWQ